MDKSIKELPEEIQAFLEQDYIESNKQPLCEFADLVPSDTHLASVIWVDSPRNMSHGKRIKFQNNTSQKLNGAELIPMTISDDPQIPKSVHSKLKISQKEVTRIKQWIILNNSVLLDYANDKITTKQLYELIQPLND